MIWCMKRTNIYLREGQSAAVEEAARVHGISRAELVRQLVDRGISGAEGSSLDADLAAIEQSFGVLGSEEGISERTVDDRTRHLDRMRRA